ncbi:cytochrome P450 [Lophiotrema nucula]|uniref:Cytochrome P450 n=1 Tax=Lophiotrema nucula TaxID=690887 RepID=A0A6A5YHY6_9PLEO|nr:cytochrome P450 [Lophiotrema nucula]
MLFADAKILALVGIVLIAILLRKYLQTQDPSLRFPVVGDAKTLDIRAALEEGNRKYPNSSWRLPLPDPIVIIPRWAAGEIKSLAENKISLNKEIFIRMLGRFTMLGEDDDEMVAVVKQDLTRALPNLFETIVDEVKFGLNNILRQGASKETEPQELSLYENMARVIALVSGRIFVGLPLSRDEHWIYSSITYTSEGVTVAESPVLRPYSPFVRWLISPFLSQVRSLRKHQAFIREKVKPLIADHLEKRQQGTTEKRDSSNGKFLDWLLARYKYEVDATRIARDYLLVAAGAIPIASGLLSQVLLELATRPQHAQTLRKELNDVIGKTGWKHAALAELQHLDSFLKETQRLNPHVLAMMPRRVMSPITLSNGETLQPGTSVAVSNHSINTSAELYPKPLEFQPDRFYELRRTCSAQDQRKYLFSNSTLEFMNFGYGTHTCPGRNFASDELKIIVAYLLSNYDFELVSKSKPDNWTLGIVQIPDPTAKLRFTKRAPIRELEI